MVITLLVATLAMYLNTQLPVDWEEAEFNTIQEVKNSFIELRDRINELDRGQSAAVTLMMGTRAPSAFNSTSTNGELRITTARSVSTDSEVKTNQNAFGWYRGYGTYIREDSPTWNYTASDYENEYYYVSTTANQRMWTFLKFDLADTGLYDSSNYVFYDDAEVISAKLKLYIVDSDLVESPENLLDVTPPLNLELWGLMNDAWSEGLSWSVQNSGNQPHDPNVDTLLDNAELSGDEEWVVFDVTSFVKEKFDNHKAWGTWAQYDWYDNAEKWENHEDNATVVQSGKFNSGYAVYDNMTGTGYAGSYLDGPLTLQSMIFDSGDNNAYWKYVDISYSGSPTVYVRFDNDDNMASPTDWVSVSDGGNPDNYARFVQYLVDLGTGSDELYSIKLEYTSHVSFVLREPYVNGENKTTTLTNKMKFNSVDNSVAGTNNLDAKLQVEYIRSGRKGSIYTDTVIAGFQSLVNFGYIRHKTHTVYLPDTNYVYEGGMIFSERGNGWYQTIVSYPPNFVTVTPLGNNKAKVEVNRFQIKESHIGGESAGGTGETMLRVENAGEEWLVETPKEPNAFEVTITISSPHEAIWRDYLERLAAETNYKLAGYAAGTFDQYGDYVEYGYDDLSLTIKPDPDRITPEKDIYYSERIIWVDVTTGYFQGGKT